MPLYLIERRYAEQLFPSPEDIEQLEQINADEGVMWLFSFLTADRMQTYCLYEAASPEPIREAARRAGLPADVIVEVSQVNADTFRQFAPHAAGPPAPFD